MPYIAKSERRRLAGLLVPLWDAVAGQLFTAGQLNFILTKLVLRFARRRGESYAGYNEALGVLEAVKLELYRRMVAPYEDKKREENGDVY